MMPLPPLKPPRVPSILKEPFLRLANDPPPATERARTNARARSNLAALFRTHSTHSARAFECNARMRNVLSGVTTKNWRAVPDSFPCFCELVLFPWWFVL
jgi:hypothetical protein